MKEQKGPGMKCSPRGPEPVVKKSATALMRRWKKTTRLCTWGVLLPGSYAERV